MTGARYTMLLMISLLFFSCPFASHAAAPTFQELMDPSVFPDAQFGMTVEKVEASASTLQVVTTGADFTLGADGQGIFRQRIGQERELLGLRIEGLTEIPEPSHKGPGLAFVSFATPKLDLRVNGDSLFMFHAHEPVTIELTRRFSIGWTAAEKSNAVMFDEFGGYGLFCSDPAFADVLRPYDGAPLRYTLPADAVLWIGICPPKPFDWEASIGNHFVWEWSKETGYPSDDVLKSWKKEGDVVLLQSEVMLWKDWNLAFEPRLGPGEFDRVRNTLHNQDMRFIVYTSPYYFLKDTPLEANAMNNFDNFEKTGFPSGWPDGSNMNLFLDEIRKVMTQYKPDGLYFDAQYMENTAALYALARHSREIVGEKGILEWHSTAALGYGQCFLPQADAYVDYILRGENCDPKYGDKDYLRYFVSCYNTSNSTGVICNNCQPLTQGLVDDILDVNARMHTITRWLSSPGEKAIIDNYRAQLTPQLRERVIPLLNERQKALPARELERKEEYMALHSPPQWSQPILTANFDDLMKWTPSISPVNKAPFAARDGALAITGAAHTHAYLSTPLDKTLSGFVVKLKQGTDIGMSWGPAVCVRWANGFYLRIGARGDGCLQIDINGEQKLFGKNDPGQWIWLRARWLNYSLIIESSNDGVLFSPIFRYDNCGMPQTPARNISVGKVPCNGIPRDHTEAGPEGTCLIEFVEVH